MKIVNTWYNINCMSQNIIGVSTKFSIFLPNNHHCIVLKPLYFKSLNSRNFIAKNINMEYIK